MITTQRTLEERYNSVHRAILDGPNAEVQELVDSGLAWRLEGRVGRIVQSALRDGAAVLPPMRYSDGQARGSVKAPVAFACAR